MCITAHVHMRKPMTCDNTRQEADLEGVQEVEAEVEVEVEAEVQEVQEVVEPEAEAEAEAEAETAEVEVEVQGSSPGALRSPRPPRAAWCRGGA